MMQTCLKNKNTINSLRFWDVRQQDIFVRKSTPSSTWNDLVAVITDCGFMAWRQETRQHIIVGTRWPTCHRRHRQVKYHYLMKFVPRVGLMKTGRNPPWTLIERNPFRLYHSVTFVQLFRNFVQNTVFGSPYTVWTSQTFTENQKSSRYQLFRQGRHRGLLTNNLRCQPTLTKKVS